MSDSPGRRPSQTAARVVLSVLAALIVGYYGYLALKFPPSRWLTVYDGLPSWLSLGSLSSITATSMIKWLVGNARGKRAAARDSVDALLDDRVADLAVPLTRAVREEKVRRGLDDPEPLEVRWRRVVAEAPGGGLRPKGTVRHEPLARIADVFLELHEGRQVNRVVITGDAGSGKTAMTLFMQLGLLERRERLKRAGRPVGLLVPVVLQLSSWDPDQDFKSWVVDRLCDLAPDLRESVKVGRTSATVADLMVEQGRLLLILDAMDEMPDGFLSRALGRINELDANTSVVVTCRTERYVGGEDLPGASVVQLQPPDIEDVRKYLTESSRGDQRRQWQLVFAHLDNDDEDSPSPSPFAEIIRSPLMVWLSAKVYRADPGELARLLDEGRFPDADALANYLLERFVPSVFEQARRRHELARAWRADRAERWLRYLAVWLKDREDSGRTNPVFAADGTRTQVADSGQDIAWWRLAEAPEAVRFVGAVAGFLGGVSAGGAVGLGLACVLWSIHVSHALFYWSIVLGFGLVAGVFMGKDCAVRNPPPTSKKIGLPRGWGAPSTAGSVALIVGASAGYVITGTRLPGLLWGLLIAAPVAAAYAFGTPFVDIEQVSTPRALYRSDIDQAIMYTIAYTVTIGMAAGVYRGPIAGLAMAVLAGFAGGVTYGAIYKIVFKRNIPGMNAWLRFRMAHFWLAFRGRLPWRLLDFLEDAHRLGVLRQTGPVYQFSHLKVRDRLAAGTDPA